MYLSDGIIFTDARPPGHQDRQGGDLCMLRAGNDPFQNRIPEPDILENREERH